MDNPTSAPVKCFGCGLTESDRVHRDPASKYFHNFVRSREYENKNPETMPTPAGEEVVKSVLQDWVMRLPLRYQGTLLTAVRGCDSEPKSWTKTGVAFSQGRRLTAFIRWCFMNPADPREVDYEEGAFFRSEPPQPFKPSEFGHLPQHWYSHVMHALEIIGYHHPAPEVAATADELYAAMVHSFHLNVETREQQRARLTEDRIVKGTVTS